MPPASGVKVKLDKPRVLRYTNRALVALEGEAGEPVGDVLNRLTAGAFRARTLMLWAGLLHAEPDLTTDEVVDRIDLTRLEEITQAIWDAMTKALGAEDEGKAKAATDTKE